MPPCAISNRPLRSTRASVNAPRTCPNISLSNSVDGTPPRFTLTNGLPTRRLLRWIASATSSLPVPLSPVTRTDASVGATRPISSQDAQHARIAPDQIAEVVARVELVARQRRFGGLRPRPHQAERRLHGLHHLLVGPRLGDEVRRAGLHPFDRQPDRSPRGDQDHRDRRHRLSDLAQQRQPLFAGGATREVHVLDDQLTRLLPQHPERFLRGPDRHASPAPPVSAAGPAMRSPNDRRRR